MIGVLVDTSVWADHFRSTDDRLLRLLADGQVRMHPFVLGELAMGNLRSRQRTIAALTTLPHVETVSQRAWLDFVDRVSLVGTGIGFVDAHLLASSEANAIMLWTRDRRLAERAATLQCNWVG